MKIIRSGAQEMPEAPQPRLPTVSCQQSKFWSFIASPKHQSLLMYRQAENFLQSFGFSFKPFLSFVFNTNCRVLFCYVSWFLVCCSTSSFYTSTDNHIDTIDSCVAFDLSNWWVPNGLPVHTGQCSRIHLVHIEVQLTPPHSNEPLRILKDLELLICWR